jgi:hypothetical protein
VTKDTYPLHERQMLKLLKMGDCSIKKSVLGYDGAIFILAIAVLCHIIAKG